MTNNIFYWSLIKLLFFFTFWFFFIKYELDKLVVEKWKNPVQVLQKHIFWLMN